MTFQHTRLAIQFNWDDKNPGYDLRDGLLRKLAPPAQVEADHVSIDYAKGSPGMRKSSVDMLARELYKSLSRSDYTNTYCYLNFNPPKDWRVAADHRETIIDLKDAKDFAENFVASQPAFAEAFRADMRYEDYNRLFRDMLKVIDEDLQSVSLEALFERDEGEWVVFVSCMVE